MISTVLLLLSSFSGIPLARGKFQANCTPGLAVRSDQNESLVISITGRVSNNSKIKQSCILKVDQPKRFLRLRAKRNDNYQGFLHVFLYEAGRSSLLGHLEVSQTTPFWETLNLCSSGSKNHDQNSGEKLLSVEGTGNLSFTVQIAEGGSEIVLDEPRTVNVRGDEVSVFQFFPPQGISDKQLDITVTSQSKVSAYLKVTQNCKEVDLQEDLESIDYKKESLRLSFESKGRITLSTASIPPLNVSISRWFIGIGLKNLSGDVKFSDSKNVVLKLTRSFDYNYTTPICVLVFASLLGGILVSVIALGLFEESLTVVKFESVDIRELQELSSGNQDSNRNNTNDELKWYQKWRKFISAMFTVGKDYWFSHGPKTFSYITGIVGSVLMVGSFQFVFANWRTMILEGDRDNCYYNDFCYRVFKHDIPFNLMISNLAYVIHGLILTICVWRLETKLYLQIQDKFSGTARQQAFLPDHVIICPNATAHFFEGRIPNDNIRDSEKKKFIAEAMKKRYCFSIGYAFSWGLIFEGLFSTLYHFCPSRFTFQFDSAFMFIIAGLTVLLLFNGIEQNRCPSSENVKYPVGASNFFLFFIVPLFIFNYFGSLFNSDSGLNKVLQGFFFTLLVIWWFGVAYWAFRKLNTHRNIFYHEQQKCRNAVNVTLFILGGVAVPLGLFIAFLFSDLAQFFLFACIVCSVTAILAKARPWKKLSCCSEGKCNCSAPNAVEIFQGFFIFFTLIILVVAFGVFTLLPTTNKTSSPENSRYQNKECVIFDFFDWHDLWHFLSSFALLMGAFVVMFISSETMHNDENAEG